MNWKILPALALGATFLAACDDDDPVQPVPTTAAVRAVHGVSVAPPVALAVDGQIALTGLAFGSTSPYAELDAGSRRLAVVPVGTADSVLAVTASFAEDDSVTVFVVGNASTIDGIILPDTVPTPAAGQARVTVVHGAPSAQTVDVYVTAPDAALAGATPTLAGVDYLDVATLPAVPAGDYRIRVTAANTQTVAFDSGTITIPAGVFSVAVVEAAAGAADPFTALIVAGG